MLHLIGVAIAAFAAYWVYSDAKGRGHGTPTALLWALGTLLLLIIFLPLYLIVGRRQMPARPAEPTIDIEGVPVEELMSCPMCGRKVKEDFKVCPYCGHTLKPKCAKCGQELNREWRTCPSCDAPAEPK
ncbi:MAG: zinc ribbon domain-containing protein [Negativicutes bacterium]|nr:zinc ribbon domain-containing protein [Negativicutes bacterium]